MTRSYLKSVLFLNGPFRLIRPGGSEVCVPSRKAQALLVLLATSENGVRERRWIEDCLWSERGRDKASASLRQALAALKRALSDCGPILSADRRHVRLDLQSLTVERSGTATFLEGFSTGDPVFEAWLDRERGNRAGPAVQPTARSAWRVNIEIADCDGLSNWFSLNFADMTARGLRETQNTPVLIGTRAEASDRLLTVTLNTVSMTDHLGVRVSIERRASGRQIWSGRRLLPLQGGPPTDDPECLSLVNDVVGAVDHYLYRNSRDIGLDEPDRLYHQAVRDLFSMQPARIAAADAGLAQAAELSDRGLFFALRAQLKTIERVERLNTDTEGLIEEAKSYYARALELEPDNSMVAAFLANTAGHLFRDCERSLEMAQLSVDLNPANPMAWWALSSASMYLGRRKRALHYALNGQRLAKLSNYRFWWDQQSFGALFAIGRHREAFDVLKSAHARNPNFRPPLRYLAALSAHFNDHAMAEGYIRKLKSAEPGFSLHQMLEDRDYPASLIRSVPGLNRERIHALVRS